MIINTGRYQFDVTHSVSHLNDAAQLIYSDAPDDTCFIDFKVSITPPSPLRRWLRPQSLFRCDGVTPFHPLPINQAYPLLEWGMNWCIAAFDFSALIIHAAVLVKNDKALIFPALPGSGKSTLTAFFSQLGWTVYSDEMAIIDLDTHLVSPLFRPVCLKNNSIQLIKKTFNNVTLTDTFPDTTKGDVAHLKVHQWDSYQHLRPAKVSGVVFPKYLAGQPLYTQELMHVEGVPEVIRHAFNYHVLGESAFTSLVKLADDVPFVHVCYEDVFAVSDFLTQRMIND